MNQEVNRILIKRNFCYMIIGSINQSIQSLSCVQIFATPLTAACQASLSITNSRSSAKPMSIKSVMPSNHLILCHPLLLLPSVFPSISVFSNVSALRIRWPKYWSFSFNISPSSVPCLNRQILNNRTIREFPKLHTHEWLLLHCVNVISVKRNRKKTQGVP